MPISRLSIGDRVEVVRPLMWRGYTGLVRVPVWTDDDGSRVIGVLLDVTARLEWVTQVRVQTTEEFSV